MVSLHVCMFVWSDFYGGFRFYVSIYFLDLITSRYIPGNFFYFNINVILFVDM